MLFKIVMIRLRLFILIFLTSLTFPANAQEAFVQRNDVQAFIHYMVENHQFNQAELTALFSKVAYKPQVIKHINKPLEANPWTTYQRLFVNEWRIKHGVQFWNKHAEALKKAEEKYGVPASIIVATLGVETKYGQRMGDFRILDALSNIAFSTSPRASYFKKELQQFLLLTREEKLDPTHLLGSYAGAIGQPQFMPSSYRHYAVNFSNSGKIDLIHNEDDVIGSIANYYQKHGWKTHEPVASQAYFLGNRYHYLMKNGKFETPRTLAEFQRYGIHTQSKKSPQDPNASVMMVELPSRYKTEYWLGYKNFAVIKRYNASDLYAMAVFQLSAYIATLREREKMNHV